MKRVLLDENLPKGLARELPSYAVSTVHDEGWKGIANGDLLKRAAQHFDVLVTADQNLQYQQNLEAAELGVVVLVAHSTRLQDLTPLVPALIEAIESVEPGELRRVGNRPG
jgi:predicted nuclease of predicted toxin-antitoxin system